MLLLFGARAMGWLEIIPARRPALRLPGVLALALPPPVMVIVTAQSEGGQVLTRKVIQPGSNLRMPG